MRKIIICLVYVLCLGFIFETSVYAMTFNKPKNIDLYKTSEIQLGSDKITFLDQRKNSGKMIFNIKGNDSKPLVIESEKEIAFVNWNFRELTTSNPNMNFLEITTTTGAVPVTCGYWLIGIHDGKLVAYISPESLKNMGWRFITYNGYGRRIYSNVENGKLILRYAHIVEGKYGYRRSTVLDSIIQAEWDSNAKWFSLKNI